MKRSVLFFIFLIMSFSFVGAGVSINEVELNPAGSDSGNEWIEIFNDGDVVNISGWFVMDKGGEIFTFPDFLLVDFFVLDELNGLVNSNEELELFNSFGTLLDETGSISDSANDDKTQSRLPDGTGDFILKNATEGFPNQETNISNKEIDLECVVESDNVTLSVDVEAFCIDEVIFSVLLNGSFMNFTGVFIGGDSYEYVVNSSLLDGSEFVN